MTVPVAPVLRGYHLDSGTCRLFWRDVPDATSYNLYRGVPGTPPSRNEKQTVTIDATGGTFKLTYSAQQTAAIAFDATAAQVKAALVALSNIGPDDVDVTKVGSVYTVEFTGFLARQNVAQMTSDATSLTGGTHTAVVATSVAGIGPVASGVTSPKTQTGSTGQPYDFEVRAVNADGEGDASNRVRIQTTVAASPSQEDTTPTPGLLNAARTGLAEG